MICIFCVFILYWYYLHYLFAQGKICVHRFDPVTIKNDRDRELGIFSVFHVHQVYFVNVILQGRFLKLYVPFRQITKENFTILEIPGKKLKMEFVCGLVQLAILRPINWGP